MPRKKTRPKPTRVPGIWQDGPDRFLVRARWTDPRTGRRRKREGMAATFAEAVSLKERLAGGDDRARRPSRKRFADYAEQWLSAHGGRLAPSTRSRYIVALAHATVQFGQFYVDSIRPADVRSWILKKARSCASSTVNGWLRVLRQALDDAVGDGVLVVNPARAVRSIPERRTGGRRGTALSIEEFRRFLQAVESLSGNGVSEDVARLLLVIAWTGLRKGEALALRWSDLVDGELRVTRSVWRRREKATKTDDPRRIAVVESLAEVLVRRTTAQWCELFETGNWRFAPVNDYEAAAADPHLVENGYVFETDHPDWGRIRTVGSPIAMSATPPVPGAVSPELGAHTDEVLADAGLSAQDIAALRDSGAIG